ncbi:hypothetical protein NQ025_13320, partial [Corynebacterium phoceense]|nr:hypothetical protein [Corynebacterium phoceense]
ATTKVVSSILERNAKAIPRGLHTARNVLVKLGNKHNKTGPDPIGADSLVSRLNAGQRIELGDYDMRQHLAHAQTTVDS